MRPKYTAARKAELLALYREHGAAETARRTGVPKGTLTSLAKRAGVTSAAAETTRAATAQYVANADARRARLADRLLELAEMSAQRVSDVLDDASVRELVGVFTRSIHDHMLLTGLATQRVETTDPRERAGAAVDELEAKRRERTG